MLKRQIFQFRDVNFIYLFTYDPILIKTQIKSCITSQGQLYPVFLDFMKLFYQVEKSQNSNTIATINERSQSIFIILFISILPNSAKVDQVVSLYFLCNLEFFFKYICVRSDPILLQYIGNFLFLLTNNILILDYNFHEAITYNVFLGTFLCGFCMCFQCFPCNYD